MSCPGEVELDPAEIGDRFGFGKHAGRVQHLDTHQQPGRDLRRRAGWMHMDLESWGDRANPFELLLRELESDQQGDWSTFSHAGHCTSVGKRGNAANPSREPHYRSLQTRRGIHPGHINRIGWGFTSSPAGG